MSCDRSRTHVWKPLLHSIAAGSLKRSQDELDYPAPRAHWSHFRYRDGEMIGLDRAAKTITLANYATPPTSREIIAYGLDKIDPERDYRRYRQHLLPCVARPATTSPYSIGA